MEKSQKILFVDDEPNITFTFKKILNQAGYQQVETAGNGEEGYRAVTRAAENDWFGLIVSDINMPNWNGLKMVTEIRNALINDPEKIPKIIFISGILPLDVKKTDLFGLSQRILEKPFEKEVLLKAVAELIGPAGEKQNGN